MEVRRTCRAEVRIGCRKPAGCGFHPWVGERHLDAAQTNWLHQHRSQSWNQLKASLPLDRRVWNKGKIVGQKVPFKLKEIWAIRVRLQLASRRREHAVFNLAIDSEVRSCDLVKLKVRDVCHGQTVASRTIVIQKKTQRPVPFEITEPTRESIGAWISCAGLSLESSLFPSRLHGSTHLSTRQYARIVDSWVRQLALDRASYGRTL